MKTAFSVALTEDSLKRDKYVKSIDSKRENIWTQNEWPLELKSYGWITICHLALHAHWYFSVIFSRSMSHCGCSKFNSNLFYSSITAGLDATQCNMWLWSAKSSTNYRPFCHKCHYIPINFGGGLVFDHWHPQFKILLSLTSTVWKPLPSCQA